MSGEARLGRRQPKGGHSLAKTELAGATDAQAARRAMVLRSPEGDTPSRPTPGNWDRRQTRPFLLPSCPVSPRTLTNTLPFSAEGASYWDFLCKHWSSHGGFMNDSLRGTGEMLGFQGA